MPDAEAWQGLCRALGRADWAADATLRTPDGRRARGEEIEREIRAWSAALPAREAMVALLQSHRVPSGLANTPRTLLADPHLAAREFFQSVAHPEAGEQPLYGPIWRFDASPARIPRAAPLIGADTRDVLGDVLGVAPAEIDRLERAKVAY